MQSLDCTYGTPPMGVLRVHHDHKASFHCFIKINCSLNCAIIYPEELAVKMAPENYKHNDADSTCTSTSRYNGQIRHYIAEEKKYGEWGPLTAQEH